MAITDPDKAARPVALRSLTEARVQLGRFGAGLPTRAAQAFLLDHARAREAVWSAADWDALASSLPDIAAEPVRVASRAQDRSTYLRRPDLGRRLSSGSAEALAGIGRDADIVLIVGDGLSARAVELNAPPLIGALVSRLKPRGLSLAPVILAAQARVALGDAVAEIVGAKISIMLIGERPGLSAAGSLGVYLTYAPKIGTPDSGRNCISNIRSGGLSIDAAADAVVALVQDMMRAGVSGIALKDRLEHVPICNSAE